MIKEFHDRVSVLIVDGRYKRSTSAVFIWGSSVREEQRQAGSVVVIDRMKHSEVHRRESIVVLTIDVDKLKHVFSLLSIAIFDVGVEKASVNNGGEETPF